MGTFLRITTFLACILTLGAYSTWAQAPAADFSASPTSTCSPALVQFTDQSTNNPTGWSWNLGNGTTSILQNPSTTYSTPGTYTITLTATNASGSHTTTKTSYITILPAPVVAFSANDSSAACGSKTVQFINSTVLGSTGSATYYWDFGDGTNSSAAAPSHTYSTPGSYTVSLVVTNGAGCTKALTKSNYITVFAKPVANFTASSSVSCSAPLTTSFTNTSTGGASYQWDFGDGNTSTSASPTHTYTTTGAYTVRLITTSAGGCKDTIVKSAFINVGSTTAAFTYSNPSSCVGSGISFTSASLPAGGTTTWYFGDGNSSTSSSPVHTYAAAGTYTVKLIYNYSGCLDSTTQTVTIYSKPSASFTGSPLTGCSAPLVTSFTNNSTGASSYLWRFGDGSTSTASGPSHTYNAAGSYNVTLIATNANGCTDSSVRNAYVVIQPIGAFINGPTYIGCAPATGNYFVSVVSPVPITSYSWAFGDGTNGTGASVTHVYNNPGTYTISVTVSSGGCSTTATGSVIVGSKPTTKFSATPLTTCINNPVSFTDSSTNALSYTWLFGDGMTSSVKNPVHYYSVPGTYTVTLITSNNGCNDTLIKTNYITVLPPAADFNFTYSCSNRRQFTFTNASTGATSYSWNFGDGNTSTATSPTHTYAAFGTYTVMLTATNSTTGCTSVMVKTVRAFNLSAAFTESDTVICKGSTLSLTATNTGYSNYAWNYGNGASGSGRTSVHSYNTAGTYNLKLTVTDGIGCKDSLIKNARIYVKSPTAAFSNTPSGGCGALGVAFTDQSTPSSGSTVTNRFWDFGDGTTLNTTATSITHTYQNAGNYSVKLVITESGGCKDSVVKANLILVDRPVAQFSSPDVLSCLGKSVSLVNSSTGTGTLTYAWTFGDGTTSSAANPAHVYPDTGNYTVRLIVSDVNGCKDTLTRTNYINVEKVTAAFTMSDSTAYCPPFTVNFTNTSSFGISYQWIFGNGSTSPLTNPSATYTAAGTYQAMLIATSANGCRDTAVHTIVVGPSPSGTLTYTPINACGVMSVTFTTTSQNTTSITYDFDNGTTQTTTASSITYTYNQPGVFVPKVIFNNLGGCATYLAGSDTIKSSKAYAGFIATPNTACVGTAIQFTDTSHTIASASSAYSWDFGDGNTSTASNPTHTYTVAGTYNVRQIVGTSLGCNDTAFRTVVINPLPVLLTNGNQSMCNGSAVQITVSGANSYSWSPATGLSCTSCANPVANPAATTTYTVTGTSSAGCSASGNVTVTVNPVPTVTASGTATICAGASTALSASGASTYAWSPAAGLSCSNCANPTANPVNTTTYKVVGTNTYGCQDSATVTVSVNPLPVIVTSGNQFICPGGSAALSASGAASYTWSPATGLSCTSCANPTASPSITTTYKVVGTSASGCIDSAILTVTLNGAPTITVAGVPSICAGNNTVLTANGANSYTWSPAAGLSCTSCASPTVAPAATTTYTVVGTSGIGCTDSTTVTVTVNPIPAVSAGPDTAICAGAAATLNASGANSYTWSPAAGLSCTSCANSVAAPSATTTYVVTGTDGNGCVKNDTVIVTVNPLPVVSAGANQAICPGDSTSLNATGAATYTWSPAIGLSCTNCANPTATPAATTTYKVLGTSLQGCIDSASVTVTVNPTPVIVVTGVDTICAGSNTSLTATGATSYVWSPAAGLSCSNCANPTATPTATTTYTITGTSADGCIATQTFTVTVNPLPVVDAGPDTNFCAGGSVTLQASGASSYIWSPAAGLSCTSCASPAANPGVTATYIVTGTSASGCVNTDSVIVTVKPLPVISAGNAVSICPNGSTVLNATGGVSYQWSPASGLSCTNCASPVASPVSNTTYIVTGTDANGCADTASVSVSINATPNVTVSGNGAICTGSSATLTASGASTYSWSPSAGLSCTNCANPVASPSATTTYSIIGTSGVGCTDTTTFMVVVNPLPNVVAGPDTSICAGSSATLSVTGANSYSWSPATGLSCTNCASPTAALANTVTYTVIGTNNNGCVGTDSVVVTVNPLPVVTVSNNVSICPGDSTVLSAGGANTYVWSPATGLSCTTCANPTAKPAATTTYTVTGTSAAGCVDTAMVTVSIHSAPNVTVTGPGAICIGSTATLNVSGASTYSWSPAASLSCTTCANPTANPASTTTYTVIGASGVGCIDTTTYTLTVNPLPIVSAGNDTAICSGTTAQLKANGASTYTWTPAASVSCATCANTIASPGATTSYVVTGTSSHGCAAADTVVVTVNPLPVVSAGSNASICLGGSVTLNPSGASTYVWNASSSLSCTTCTSPVATPGATTVYTVTGSDANGCSSTSSVTVTVNPRPALSISGTTNVCAGSSTVITASGAASYSWSPSAGLSCTTCPNPTVTPAATTTYTVVGTSGLGCVDSATITINLRPLPHITVDTPRTVCLNTPVQLSASGAASYSWTPTSGLSCTTCPSPVATPAATTTYIVAGTDSYGCMDTAQTTITILNLPQVNAGPDVNICQTTSTTLTATGALSYVWAPAATLSCTACASTVATPTVNTAYAVTGTGANGCVNTDTVLVSIYAQPPVDAGQDQTICAGQQAQLQASGAALYVWNPAQTLSCATCANPVAAPMQHTTYTVIGTDVHGCVDSDRVHITVIQHNPVGIGPGGEICAGESVHLTATGGDSYFWYPASGLSCINCANPTATPANTTTYFVSIRQGQCFADTLSAEVIVHPLPTIHAGEDKSIILGNPVQINTTGTNIQTYSWSPVDGLSCTNCASPMASPARETTYIVSVTSPFGCTAQDEVTVRVRCDGSQLWLPNTFTPNADGQNDRFYPHGKGILTIARFRIYNRWGELLYDRANMPVNDRSYGWDGTYKNQPLKPDVFVWVIDAECTNGEHTQTKGDISLIR